MELGTFMEVLSARLQRRLGEKYEISVVTNFRNNSVKVTGMTLKQEGNPISPTIYADDLLVPFNQGQADMDEIEQEIINRYERSKETVKDLDCLDIENGECTSRIIFRLVSRELNQHLLTNMPYIPFLDMAITFHLVAGVTGKYMQTIRITKELQKKWGLSVEMLLKLAKKNTEKILPAKICGLTEMIEKYLGAEERKFTVAEQLNLIVVTNQLGVNGASAILYEDMMDKLAEQFGTNLCIVPSSIHEIIIVPDHGQEIQDMFLGILREINSNFVPKDEVLSNQVYLYRKDDKKFI